MSARVTVVEQISYQSETVGTLSLSGEPFARAVKSDEQPYQRVVTIGEEWKPLDLGWIEDCYMLIVCNRAPVRTTYPTAEETAVTQDAVVELSVDLAPFTEIPIGENCRLYPLAQFHVRCRKGSTTIVVTAIPK